MTWVNLNTIPIWILRIFGFLITYRMNENRLLILNADVFFSFGGVITVRKAVRTTNRSTQLQDRNIARAQLRATAARHWCTIEVRSEDVRERIGQAKLVSRVVYKLAFDRGLEPLSFSLFLAPSPLLIQSLIVDSR